MVGIIGHGFVGLACETGFQEVSDVLVYDKYKSSDSLDTVVENSKIIFLCVPTPMGKDNRCDTSILEDVVYKINKLSKERKILVIKSTVVPGTTQSIAKKYRNHGFFFNPEFLTEEHFISDFLNQDRIVIGKTEDHSYNDLKVLVEFYEKFTNSQKLPAKIIVTKSNTAEALKYFTNCFLATKLSFFNEMYELCQKAGIEYDSVIEILLQDRRIGKSHVNVPGSDGLRGWGKSCFPKDLNALMMFGFDLGVDMLMLESAWTKNLLVREEQDWENLSQVTGEYEQ